MLLSGCDSERAVPQRSGKGESSKHHYIHLASPTCSRSRYTMREHHAPSLLGVCTYGSSLNVHCTPAAPLLAAFATLSKEHRLHETSPANACDMTTRVLLVYPVIHEIHSDVSSSVCTVMCDALHLSHAQAMNTGCTVECMPSLKSLRNTLDPISTVQSSRCGLHLVYMGKVFNAHWCQQFNRLRSSTSFSCLIRRLHRVTCVLYLILPL